MVRFADLGEEQLSFVAREALKGLVTPSAHYVACEISSPSMVAAGIHDPWYSLP